MKKIFQFLMLGMAVCAGVSCSSDDEGGDSGAPGVQSGTLAGDDANANAAVAGLRIVSVGDFRYTYDDNGKLETISDRYGDFTLSAKDNFKIEEKWESDGGHASDEETITFNISSNHITGFSCKYNIKDSWGGGEYTANGNGTGSLTYNSKGQLASIKFSSTENVVDKEDGETEKYTDSEKGTITFTYSSDNRLTKVELEIQEVYGGKNTYTCKKTYEYDYSQNIPNLFYQYTPRFVDAIDMESYAIDAESEMEAFAYVGLLGKASSYIPSKCVVKRNETWKEDGENEEESREYTQTFSCQLNDNGAISYADGDSYAYTNMGTRAVFAPTSEQGITAKNERKSHRGLLKRLGKYRHHQQRNR